MSSNNSKAADSTAGRFTNLEIAMEAETKEIHHLANVGKTAIGLGFLFVAVACITTGVIVGSRSTSFDGKNDLTNKKGEVLKTAAFLEKGSIILLNKLKFQDLKGVDTIAFMHVAPGGDGYQETMFSVNKISRANGITTVCNAGEISCVAIGVASANYTDGRFCKAAAPCAVLLEAPLDRSTGRRLWSWWNPVSWFTSTPTKKPIWKATKSKCAWACRQGWWWQSKSYGKPACCKETHDSGSPYDTCANGKCQCDASCASCCDEPSYLEYVDDCHSASRVGCRRHVCEDNRLSWSGVCEDCLMGWTYNCNSCSRTEDISQHPSGGVSCPPKSDWRTDSGEYIRKKCCEQENKCC